MDDELPVGVWSLDPETRAALRLDRVRRLMSEHDYVEAIIEVEELLDEEPDNAEGLYLLGESLLEVGEAPIARDAYSRQIRLTGGDARSLLGLAITRYDTCDLPGAAEAARDAIRLDSSQAEAHWYLGLSLERLAGSATESVQAFAVARQLEPDAYPFPIVLDDPGWRSAIVAGMAKLHLTLQAFWSGVPVRLDEWPDLAELERSDPPIPPGVCGMYVGEPPEEGDPWEVRPSEVRLFRRNLERARDLDELVDQIAVALEAEALDWLALVDISELDDEDADHDEPDHELDA